MPRDGRTADCGESSHVHYRWRRAGGALARVKAPARFLFSGKLSGMRTLLSLCAVILAACLVAQPLGEPWTRADLIQPEQLAARLKNGHAAPPIFYVGF